MNPITITLPYPISSNRYWRPVRIGAHITIVPTKEAKAYKQHVATLALIAGFRKPITGRVAIDIKLYPHRPLDWQKRMKVNGASWDDTVQCIDLDNANKVLLDSLKGVAIEDDKWVRRLVSERMEPDGGEARVVVTITPLIVVQPQVALFEFKPMEAAQWLG
jgi:crossover junction endodeoxyribonuclease RusA